MGLIVEYWTQHHNFFLMSVADATSGWQVALKRHKQILGVAIRTETETMECSRAHKHITNDTKLTALQQRSLRTSMGIIGLSHNETIALIEGICICYRFWSRFRITASVYVA